MEIFCKAFTAVTCGIGRRAGTKKKRALPSDGMRKAR